MRPPSRRLHRLGWAHSLEVWDGGALVGGLYGVMLGGVFTGESMFHRTSDASKVALVDLVARFAEAGGSLIDVQLVTPHLASLGARELPRGDYLALLRQVRDRHRATLGPCDWPRGDYLALLRQVRDQQVRLPDERRPVVALAAAGRC